MRTKRGAYLVVIMLTGLTPARAAAQSTGTVVRAIQIVEESGITHVTIEADGPLPLPHSESLNNPPRIFFDLPGVTYKFRSTTVPQGGGVVSRVRVALRPGSPPVTRVVLDLTRPESYHADADETQAGRIRVRIGPESAIDLPPTTRRAVPSAAAPASAAPASANASSTSVAPARIAGTPPPPRCRPATPRRRRWRALPPVFLSRHQRLPGPHQLLEAQCRLLNCRERRSRSMRSWFIANRRFASLRGWRNCERSSPESTRARASIPTPCRRPRRSSRTFAAAWRQCSRPRPLLSLTIY